MYHELEGAMGDVGIPSNDLKKKKRKDQSKRGSEALAVGAVEQETSAKSSVDEEARKAEKKRRKEEKRRKRERGGDKEPKIEDAEVDVDVKMGHAEPGEQQNFGSEQHQHSKKGGLDEKKQSGGDRSSAVAGAMLQKPPSSTKLNPTGPHHQASPTLAKVLKVVPKSPRLSPENTSLLRTFRLCTIDWRVHLPAKFIGDFTRGVDDYLSRYLMKYLPELPGVLLSYDTPEPLTRVGAILYDTPHLHYTVRTDAVVWSPGVGDYVVGTVTLSSPTHLSCLVHRVFNLFVPSENIPERYVYDAAKGLWLDKGVNGKGTDIMEEGSAVGCWVSGLVKANEMLTLRGTLMPPPARGAHLSPSEPLARPGFLVPASIARSVNLTAPAPPMTPLKSKRDANPSIWKRASGTGDVVKGKSNAAEDDRGDEDEAYRSEYDAGGVRYEQVHGEEEDDEEEEGVVQAGGVSRKRKRKKKALEATVEPENATTSSAQTVTGTADPEAERKRERQREKKRRRKEKMARRAMGAINSTEDSE
ncbi:hypothetical protein HDU93_004333 [Gonapodya sp. JEL0774]|nr:hypothetical protein HDU93_004333 [Gonapodya sp. JEL0774]